MNNDIDNLKKKILYRSTYRGTKEMDNLISSFVKSIINDLEYDDLKQLEKFLDIDDDNLLRFYNNIDNDTYFEENEITKKFKNFKLNQK